MKTFRLILANCLSLTVQFILFAIAYVAAVGLFFLTYREWGILPAVLLIPIFGFAAAFCYILELFLIRLVVPKPRIGVHPMGGAQHFIYSLNNRIFNCAVKSTFPPLSALYHSSNIFRILVLKALGANVRFSSNIASTVRIHDPYLLTVGTGAIVGDDTQLFSFARESGKIIIQRLFIGPKAHVSSGCLMFPGTEIGEGSVLGMGSSTRNEMKIPSFELWVGDPAGHLSRLSRPFLYTASKPFEKPDRFSDSGRQEGRRPREDRPYREGRGFRRPFRGDRHAPRHSGMRDDRRDESRYEPKSQPRPEPRPEPRQETRPEPKPEPRPEPKPEPRQETRPEPKPEPRPEPKPEPKPAPRENIHQTSGTPYIGPIDTQKPEKKDGKKS